MKSYQAIICIGIMKLLCSGATLHAQEFLNLNTQVAIHPASEINTKHLEYAPIYYGQGIVFVHAKEQDQWIDIKLGMPFFELMYAELSPDGMPGKATSFSSNIRTRFHEGPTAFSNDLRQVFFTRSNTTNGQNVVGADKRTNLKIYVADKGPEDWENLRELSFCSDDYSVQSPTLSPDNQQIVFMSDMPGGYGAWDLYISTLANGAWSEPVNLGPLINTAKNERLPFWHEKNVLFFSSDGHQGLGGLDVFATFHHDNRTFSAPVNLGPKFNSRQDDLSFICDVEGKNGFFASARKEGLGKDDIYGFHSDESIFSSALLESALVEMSLMIRDGASLTPVPEVSVWIYPLGPFGPEGLTADFDKIMTKNADGSEVVELKPKSHIPPYVSDIKGSIPIELNPNKDYMIILRADDYIQRDVTLQRGSIKTGQEYLLSLDLEKPAVVDRVPDKDCISTGARVVSSMNQTPLSTVLVQVRSACTGTVQVMETDVDGKFRTCVIPGCDYEVRLLKTGFLEQTYRYVPGSDPAERIVYMTEADLEARTGGKPEPGDVLILEHIYYDFNKSAIRTGDARELESLANMLMKYPAMTIELQSHTDSRGNEEYNLELSERRGVSVKEFLLTRGVKADRVTLKPMGESQLRNKCKDGVACNDEEHQENRRTEIRFLTVDPHVEVRYSGQ